MSSSPLPGAQFIETPKWVLFVRGAQALLAVVILGLSAHGIYWIAFDCWGIALWSSIYTMIFTAYAIVTTILPNFQKFNNWIAILALNAIGNIFWIASMGDLASTRAVFTIPVLVDGCDNSGNGGICYKMAKRDFYVAEDGYLASMTAAALLSALEFVLFAATLAIFAINVNRQRTRPQGPITNDKVEALPMENQTYDQVPQQQASEEYPEVHPENYGQH